MKSCSQVEDKPWIINKKKISGVVKQTSSSMHIEKLRELRMASIDSKTKLLELIEGDQDLTQEQTLEIIDYGPQLSNIRMKKGIKLLNDSAIVIRSGDMAQKPNFQRTFRHSQNMTLD